MCAACDANNTHIYHTQEGPRLQLGEIASLYFREKINTNPACENIRFSDATRVDGILFIKQGGKGWRNK